MHKCVTNAALDTSRAGAGTRRAAAIVGNGLGDSPQERLRREDVGRPDQDSAGGVLLLELVDVPAEHTG